MMQTVPNDSVSESENHPKDRTEGNRSFQVIGVDYADHADPHLQRNEEVRKGRLTFFLLDIVYLDVLSYYGIEPLI